MSDVVNRPGGGLSRYMQCMDKLRRAVQYLTVNNPNSSQLSHVVSGSLHPIFVQQHRRKFFD